MNPEFMREAIALSLENVRAGRGGPFAAVIVKDGKIIGRGINLVTSSNDPTAHAEIVAIRQACQHIQHFHLTDCEIYTTCEPCPMCLAAIYWARLSKIYYANTRDDAAAIGFDDAFLYREITLPHAQRAVHIEQVLRNEALEAFKLWKEKDDKIRY
ncbi:MAG: nucleoside deaminase [Candidatus Thermochlorobacter sp.]